MTRNPPPDILRRQHLVLATWQGPKVGIQPRVLKRRLRSGQWQQLTTHAVLTAPIEPTPRQLRIAACLEFGPSAVLAGMAALAEWGWRGDYETVDVIVPPKSNLRRTVPLWIRPRYTDAGQAVVASVARTSAARSALDAASWARSDRETAYILLSATQQRITSAGALSRELHLKPRRRRAPLIRELIGEAEGGTSSMPELDFGRMCRERGLPEPRRQTKRSDATGRTRYTDVEFDLPGGGLLIVEIDGAGHLDPSQAAADTLRTSALARATGAQILRVQSWLLRTDPDSFFDELSQWLGLDMSRYIA